MAEIPEKLKNFLNIISNVPDEQQRIELLVDYADKFKNVPPEIAQKPYSKENEVAFCESGAYVWTVFDQHDKPKFYFAIENPHGISAKSLAVILDKTLSGESPDLILNVNPDVIFKIFGQSLSMGKNVGLAGILLMMQRDIRNYLNDRFKINEPDDSF